ncbi:DUF397 domain-containing protein [Kitasatospora cineracea]
MDPASLRWVKSSYSDNGGDCIEVAPEASQHFMPVRDSKDPEGPALVFSRSAFAAFVAAAAAGEFGEV